VSSAFDPGAVQAFYDQLAPEYHRLFADWTQAVQWQGETLDRLIRVQKGSPPLAVLDCSCGIGTQAIGLAARGYTVHATDLSPVAVARAELESQALGVSLTFGVADLRSLEIAVPGTFDVVISCDNALPHLLTEAELQRAMRSIRSRLRADGLLLVSLRDYDQLLQVKPQAEMPRVFDDAEGRRIVLQVWDWLPDGRTYRLQLFVLQQRSGAWETAEFTTEYRALRRQELDQILSETGFAEIRWHLPEASGYYQPIVTARKR
jgi:glycine/sarcosine N-methyltransferase